MTHWVIVLFGALAAANVDALEMPPDFAAHYTVKKGFLNLGTARRALKRENATTWLYESETHSAGGLVGALFKFHEIKQSRITIEDDHLRVNFYSHKREGSQHIQLEQRYAWDKNKVTTRWDNGEALTYDLVPLAYDQNMYQLSVMLDLARGLTMMDYALAENKRLKNYQIRLVRREKLKTQLGEFDTLVIANRDNSSETMMWCSPAFRYLPLRIEYEDNGLRINAEINRVEGLSP